ncbi:MAG: hypothetical protein ABFS46_09160 [Myxococcota bacterium]
MGRILGIGFIVLAVWAGVEIYSEGTAGAFGGLLTRTGLVAEEEAQTPVTERAAAAWQDAYHAAEDRVERQLD